MSMPAQIHPRRSVHLCQPVLHASASRQSGKKRQVCTPCYTPKVYTYPSLDAAHEEELKKKMANYEKELRSIGKKKTVVHHTPVDQGMSVYQIH